MRIWWCQEHEASGDEQGCWVSRRPMQANVPHCRLVPMRLIPDNAELRTMLSRVVGEEITDDILAVLDGETP